MQAASDLDFNALLQQFSAGDPVASEKLIALLYSELHAIASRFMSGQPQSHTLQATALVSEAYLRLLGDHGQSWNNRKHLMAAAATAMRWVLVDHARKRKRRVNLDSDPLALDSVLVTYESRAIDLLALEDALVKLAAISPEMARAVELRFFAGLSLDEVAEILDMPRRTLVRQWETARVWLFERMA
jgi:RNA polymerase sigma factor (TIGR02999 family)